MVFANCDVTKIFQSLKNNTHVWSLHRFLEEEILWLLIYTSKLLSRKCLPTCSPASRAEKALLTGSFPDFNGIMSSDPWQFGSIIFNYVPDFVHLVTSPKHALSLILHLFKLSSRQISDNLCIFKCLPILEILPPMCSHRDMFLYLLELDYCLSCMILNCMCFSSTVVYLKAEIRFFSSIFCFLNLIIERQQTYWTLTTWTRSNNLHFLEKIF